MLSTDSSRGSKTSKARLQKVKHFIQEVTKNRLMCFIKINGKCFEGLVDTDVDVSLIALEQWPTTWPTQSVPT